MSLGNNNKARKKVCLVLNESGDSFRIWKKLKLSSFFASVFTNRTILLESQVTET